MALSDSALSELLDALRVGNGTDLVRELAQVMLQQLIETEASAVIGAARYERNPDRTVERNGHRAKVLSTKAGDLDLQIPKLRKGSFFPSIIEPRRRIDQALYAVVMEAYVSGVSTRSVDDLVAALGIDTGISKSEVSRICGGLDERVEAFRGRTLGHVAFPYCISTPLTSKSATTPWAKSCHALSWSRLASLPKASVRCSALTLATPKTRRSGPGSSARSKPADSQVCAS